MVDITAESRPFYMFMDIRFSSQFDCCEIVKRAAINVFTKQYHENLIETAVDEMYRLLIVNCSIKC